MGEEVITLREAKARDRAFYKGVRACIARLHELAREMNDPHAKAVLNSAAFDLGVNKPGPGSKEESSEQPAEPCFTCNGEGRIHDLDAHPGMFRPADMTRECPTCEGSGKAEGQP